MNYNPFAKTKNQKQLTKDLKKARKAYDKAIKRALDLFDRRMVKAQS